MTRQDSTARRCTIRAGGTIRASWRSPGRTTRAEPPRRAPAVPPVPRDADQLVVNVRLTRPGPIPTPQSILPYRNALVVNEYEVLDVLSGAYTDKTIQIAQWVIR